MLRCKSETSVTNKVVNRSTSSENVSDVHRASRIFTRFSLSSPVCGVSVSFAVGEYETDFLIFYVLFFNIRVMFSLVF